MSGGAMPYRRLGRSGLEVSALCVGAMMFGDRTDAAEADRILGHARDHGVNFIDTADVYAEGRSEEIVGRVIAGQRDRWIVATKVGSRRETLPRHAGGVSRRWVLRAIDESLRRLGTDYVDVYYLHRDDPSIPLEETVSAIGDILRAGKARYFGISNYRGWRISQLVALCQAAGVPRPVVCQPYYNALNRQPEVEVLPACDHFGIGVVPYSPIARGVLTGKYAPGGPVPEDSRVARSDRRMMQTEWRPESLEIAARIKARAEERGLTATAFAVGWLLRNRIVSSVLAGPRTLAQWQGYLDGATARLDDDDEAFVDALVKPGHASTPGYSDPAYPIRGRRFG